MLTIGSLFSGIGGLELGLERGLLAGGVQVETIWQVEKEDYPRRVLARHWPHAERFVDVRDITAENTPTVDILCGGFPCQDISSAGAKRGIEGERSSLFFEMVRIVRDLRPAIWVMENVPAITARGLDAVLWQVASLGYAARWGMLSAQEVGAPHRRERWFCVAWRSGVGQADPYRQRGGAGTRLPEGREPHLPDSDRRNGSSTRTAAVLADTVCSAGKPDRHPAGVGRVAKSDSANRPGSRARQTESRVGRGADGLSARVDRHRWPAPPGPQYAWEPPRTHPRQPDDRARLMALGNAVVPQCAEVIGRWIAAELLVRGDL